MIASISDWLGEMSASQASVAIAIISGVVSIVTLVFAKRGAQEAKAANQAVNGVAPGEPRLYDLAAGHAEELKSLSSWRESWDTSPWHNGDEAQLWVTQNEERWDEVKDILRDLQRREK